MFSLLLQVLDDGRLTDGVGRTVNFRNTVLIMTSNVGSEDIASTTRLGFGAGGGGSDDDAVRARVMTRLRETFRPEFLNRIDEIVVFRRLDADQLHRITELLLRETLGRVEELGVHVKVLPEAVRWLAERGYQPEFGARPPRRAIQRELGNRLSQMLLDGQAARGDTITVGVAEDALSLERQPGAAGAS